MTKLQEYRQLMIDLAEARRLVSSTNERIVKLESQSWKLKQDAIAEAPKPEYKYTGHVSIHKEGGWGTERSIPLGVEVLTLHGTCINKPALEADGIYASLEDRHSLRYWRHEGRIIAVGGGFLTLKEYEPCSDEEWEGLKRGIIPDHLKYVSQW